MYITDPPSLKSTDYGTFARLKFYILNMPCTSDTVRYSCRYIPVAGRQDGTRVWRRVHDSSGGETVHRLCQCRSPSSAAYPFPYLYPSLNHPPCSDKTCRHPRHIAYDPDRTAGKTNGRDAKTSSSYSGQDYFEMKTAPGFASSGSSAAPHSEGRKRRRRRNMKLSWRSRECAWSTICQVKLIF